MPRPLGGIHVAHGQAHAALAIDLEHLDAHHIAFLELVADTLDPLFGNLRDVDQTVAARQDGHECTEIHQARDLAFVYAAHLDIGRDELYATLRLAAGRTLHRRDFHRAVVFDVDGSARLFGDLTDHGAALADDVADFLRIDLQGDDGGRPLGHVFAGLGQYLVHFIQDMQATALRLIQGNLHDLARDARDLDVHLQRGNAVFGTGHFEIHVAEMILIAQNIGEHLKACAFLDQPHGHAGHRRLDGHACVHQCKTAAAHRGHRTRAIGLQDLRHDPNDIRKLLDTRHHRLHSALRKIPVSDLAPLRRTHHAGLADAERREVVVQHEGFFAFTGQAVDDLRITPRAQRRDHQGLRLAAGKERGTVRPGQHAGADLNGPHRLGVAAVDAQMAVQYALADQTVFQIEEFGLDLIRRELERLAAGLCGRELRLLALGERVDGGRLDFTDLGVALLLLGERVRID